MELLLLVFYFLPTLIALSRKRDNCAAIFALNLFAGWTFFGWIGALIWACMLDEEEKAIRRSKRKY